MTPRKNSNELSSEVPVASYKLTFNNINEYEKDFLTLTLKRTLKKMKGRKTEKKGKTVC